MSLGPANQGFAPPAITPSVSAAAGLVRSAAVTANISSHELPVHSRSVVDQNNLPCCVSSALGAAMEVLNPAWPSLAPLFHYYVARYEDGGANVEGFLYLDNALVTLTVKGICRGDLHPEPYTEAGAATKPSTQACADASTRALGLLGRRPRYLPVSGLSSAAWIRDQLNLDHPVVIGLQLPMTYPDSFLNCKFEWLDPDAFPRSDSGHCILAIGYDDARQAFHVQDCHGAGQFNQGCWWMGYRVVDSSLIQGVYSLLP
jgi:hypothetical protein